ncbi:hypothetical protein [Enterococcus nangangensis]|uniref:hypothetical protein n=1 Tax=Enterococcus nangangensis TaxID=2559926 RepID=UPI0010F92DEA|nr:hypothetical protein [Enterococcus nangangensis]
MKKANFIVIFWLLLALISFVTFLIQLGNFWDNLAYLILPYTNTVEDYLPTTRDIQRDLIRNVPMLAISGLLFGLFLRQGLKLYHALPNPTL